MTKKNAENEQQVLEVALRWSSDVKRRQFSSLACSMVSLVYLSNGRSCSQGPLGISSTSGRQLITLRRGRWSLMTTGT